MRKRTLLLLIAGALVLFFIFVPVVPTDLVPCVIHTYGPDYASLSNHFFGIGAVYLGSFPSGSYQLWTHGVVFCF